MYYIYIEESFVMANTILVFLRDCKSFIAKATHATVKYRLSETSLPFLEVITAPKLLFQKTLSSLDWLRLSLKRNIYKKKTNHNSNFSCTHAVQSVPKSWKKTDVGKGLIDQRAENQMAHAVLKERNKLTSWSQFTLRTRWKRLSRYVKTLTIITVILRSAGLLSAPCYSTNNIVFHWVGKKKSSFCSCRVLFSNLLSLTHIW